MRSQGYINKSFFNKSSSSQFKIEETAELTRLDTITYKHNRIIIEPSSPAVAGFFVSRHLGVAGRNIGCMRGKK